MYYGASDIGLIRSENQDNFTSITNENGDILHIVCDGIGGGVAGDQASISSISYLAEKFAATGRFKSLSEAKYWFNETILETNQHILAVAEAASISFGMGTTLLAAFLGSVGNFVMNIGDSRAFVVEAGQLHSLTTDHNLANELYKQGKIELSEVAHHPKRNVLTNAIGIKQELLIDVFDVPTAANLLLLSSDGLHDYVDFEVIEAVLLKENFSLQAKVTELINLSNQAGGFDNVTMILIELLKDGKKDAR